MLTNRALLGLERALSEGQFRPEDFEIEQSDAGSNTTELRVLYRYNPTYKLDATFNNSKPEVITETETTGIGRMMGALGSTIRRNRQDDPITVTINPGEICNAEELGASTYEKFLGIVRKWVGCIQSELGSTPQWRELNAWRGDVEKMLAELELDADGAGEHFSPGGRRGSTRAPRQVGSRDGCEVGGSSSRSG